MRRSLSLVIVAIAVWLAATPSALAGMTYASDIRIKSDTISGGIAVFQVTGIVRSEKRACRVDRVVNLYRPDDSYYASDYATEPDGSWVIDGSGPTGVYRAEVIRQDAPSGRGTCMRDSVRKMVD